jgi:hypothetical protein
MAPATRKKNLASLIFFLVMAVAALLASFMHEGDQIVFVISRPGLLAAIGIATSIHRVANEVTRYFSKDRGDG